MTAQSTCTARRRSTAESGTGLSIYRMNYRIRHRHAHKQATDQRSRLFIKSETAHQGDGSGKPSDGLFNYALYSIQGPFYHVHQSLFNNVLPCLFIMTRHPNARTEFQIFKKRKNSVLLTAHGLQGESVRDSTYPRAQVTESDKGKTRAGQASTAQAWISRGPFYDFRHKDASPATPHECP